MWPFSEPTLCVMLGLAVVANHHLSLRWVFLTAQGTRRLRWIGACSHFTSCSKQITAAPCNRLPVALTKASPFREHSSCFALACWHPQTACIQYINRCNTSTTTHKIPLWQTHQECAVLLTIVWLLLYPQCPAGSGFFVICVLALLFQNESMCHPGSSSVLSQINLEAQQISKDFMSYIESMPNTLNVCNPLQTSQGLLKNTAPCRICQTFFALCIHTESFMCITNIYMDEIVENHQNLLVNIIQIKV